MNQSIKVFGVGIGINLNLSENYLTYELDSCWFKRQKDLKCLGLKFENSGHSGPAMTSIIVAGALGWRKEEKKASFKREIKRHESVASSVSYST